MYLYLAFDKYKKGYNRRLIEYGHLVLGTRSAAKFEQVPSSNWHTQGVCTAQCCAMFLCYLEDNLVGKCTCTHMMGLNTTTAHGLCSVHIRSIHIGVHIRSSAHLHTWRGAHISSHSMSPTSAMRSRLGSSATRVERHSPKIWLLHLSPS